MKKALTAALGLALVLALLLLAYFHEEFRFSAPAEVADSPPPPSAEAYPAVSQQVSADARLTLVGDFKASEPKGCRIHIRVANASGVALEDLGLSLVLRDADGNAIHDDVLRFEDVPQAGEGAANVLTPKPCSLVARVEITGIRQEFTRISTEPVDYRTAYTLDHALRGSGGPIPIVAPGDRGPGRDGHTVAPGA